MSSLNFKKIMVPTDFSGTAARAIEHASFLAKRNNAEITLVHVLEPVSHVSMRMTYPVENFSEGDGNTSTAVQRQMLLQESIEGHTSNDLLRIETKLKKDNITIADSIIETGKISKRIVDTAKRRNADIIIMGTHGTRGFREFMAGSNTYKVVKHAKCPVLSIREECDVPGFKTILLPFIDRPHMREHVDYAIKLAKIYDATLDVLGIDTYKETNHFRKVHFEAEQIQHLAAHAGVKCNFDVYPASYVNEFIMGYCENKKADLIAIMADMNRMSIMQYFTGPIVQQIVNHSPIPVLSIPPLFNPNNMH